MGVVSFTCQACARAPRYVGNGSAFAGCWYTADVGWSADLQSVATHDGLGRVRAPGIVQGCCGLQVRAPTANLGCTAAMGQADKSVDGPTLWSILAIECCGIPGTADSCHE